MEEACDASEERDRTHTILPDVRLERLEKQSFHSYDHFFIPDALIQMKLFPDPEDFVNLVLPLSNSLLVDICSRAGVDYFGNFFLE